MWCLLAAIVYILVHVVCFRFQFILRSITKPRMVMVRYITILEFAC